MRVVLGAFLPGESVHLESHYPEPFLLEPSDDLPGDAPLQGTRLYYDERAFHLI